ncbi:alpha/beta hydrolase [Halomonas piscis]|uniref:Alpha/beta hydrolase n=1 Tax=Halomonas piscis TaxID=3031727 RepID=A0ABY9Z4B6_9GAMM|nr:alpha/beta hydrolase [Halomonas piscis]WNK21591.1 alpha/beta hydrolase [Halomonas piscis]
MVDAGATDVTSLSLAEGRIAALAWGREQAPVWLGLHGWLDNAASFSRLGPQLAERLDIRLVALDFRGHGLSAANAVATDDYAIWDYGHDVLDAMDALALDDAVLVGHSMGAAVACLLAAALPEKIRRLVLIDGLGMLSTAVEDTASQLRRGFLAHRLRSSRMPGYADVTSAVAARVAGGVTPIDADTAAPLVERNSRRLEDGRVTLRTDSRLLKPSPVRFTPEQVLALLADIRCPVQLVEGEQGILGERAFAAKARAAVPNLTRQVVPGGHHLHLERDRVNAVADAVVNGCAAGQALR